MLSNSHSFGVKCMTVSNSKMSTYFVQVSISFWSCSVASRVLPPALIGVSVECLTIQSVAVIASRHK